ncbi:MAG: DUF4174 domain-containing protein, partial [Bacteroidota bacterium]
MSRALLLGIALLLGMALILGAPVMAQSPAVTFDEAEHRWQHRLFYVFAPSDTLDAFAATLASLQAKHDAIAERDALVLALPHEGTARWLNVDRLSPDVGPALRARYDVDADDAVLVLVGKDGTEKHRYALPVALEDVLARIDSMP